MSDGSASQISDLLSESQRGDPRAAAELLPLVYAELRKLAESKLKQLPPGLTLQPTALVHEAYLRIAGENDPGWNGRGHFFAAAALAMRRILVDQARRKGRVKHGGGRKREVLDQQHLAIESPGEDVLAIDEALKELENNDARKGEIVNLRYFVGMTNEEVAKVLDVSVSTVEREWKFCRHWLFKRLKDDGN